MVLECMDIINDLENATDITVEILDDILTYEKLTSNILKLEKNTVNVKADYRFIHVDGRNGRLYMHRYVRRHNTHKQT